MKGYKSNWEFTLVDIYLKITEKRKEKSCKKRKEIIYFFSPNFVFYFYFKKYTRLVEKK